VPGEPTSIEWEADVPLSLSDLLLPGEGLADGSPDPMFHATIHVTAELPPEGGHMLGWTIFGVGVWSTVEGQYCISTDCISFDRAGPGMGQFIFAESTGNQMVLADVQLFGTPEPASIVLLGLSLLLGCRCRSWLCPRH
jgi:hypothetical protein